MRLVRRRAALGSSVPGYFPTLLGRDVWAQSRPLLVVIALLRLAGARGTMETVVTDTFFAEKFADRAETVRTQSSPSQIIEHHRAPTCAYGALHSNGPIQSMIIDRRVLLPDDVAIDVLYCGVCHSAIHMIRGEWGEQPFPMVPGHEFVGRVSAVGQAVTRSRPKILPGWAAWSTAAAPATTARLTSSNVALRARR